MPRTSSQTTAKKAKKGIWNKVASFATGKGKPFLAIIIVLGVAGFGYYGYVRSNADTLANTPPTVKCANRLTAKECQQKQAASDAQFYAALQKDCTAANRIFSGNSCGNCQKGFYDNSGTCTARKKVDCAVQNLIQKDDYNCGGCTAGFFMKGDVCKERQKIDCSIENRVQTDPYTCGNCKATFAEVGGNCITRQGESAALLCAKAFKNYDAATNSCTTCLTNYELVNGVCKKTAATTETPAPHSPPLTPGNATLTKADCDKVLREFNVNTKQCGDCKSGYVEKSGGCAKVLSTTEQCAINGNGRCLAPETVKKVCEASHRRYDTKTNTCKDDCVNGWYLEANICNKVSTVEASKVKASCDAQFLQYDRETNRCLTKCKATYVMRDSKCVAWTEAGMTQWRCDALGRVWVPATQPEGNVAGMEAFCSAKCAVANAQAVNTGSDNTSYCKVSAAAGAGTGVAVGMTREECAKQHRAYVGALEGCSARCQTGWFLDDGKCSEVKPTNENVVTTEGDGATGGCSLPLQDGSAPVEGGVINEHNTGGQLQINVTLCPEDEPNAPPVPTAPGVPVTHDVAVLMSHATCTALGRAWVPDANTVNGTKKGGCSTQECLVSGAEVRRSNGSAYCEGSIDRISQQECNKAHRDWLSEVNGCAALPSKQGDNSSKVNAKQCDPPYTVYVQHTEKQGADECVKPSTLQRLQGIAQATSKPVSYLASLAPRALCNLQDNKQWIDGKCVKQRVPSNNTNPAGAGGTPGNDQSAAGGGTIITAAWCRDNLGRGYNAADKTCSRACVQTGYAITNYTDPSKWDQCQKKNADGTAADGSVSCPAGMVEDNGRCIGHGGNTAGATPALGTTASYPIATLCTTMHNYVSGSNCGATNSNPPVCVNQWKEKLATAKVSGKWFRGTVCVLRTT